MVQTLGIPKYRTTCHHKLIFASGPPIERGMREFHPSSRGCCENGIGYKRLAADPDHGSSAGQGMQRRQLPGRRGRGRQRAVAQWARLAKGHIPEGRCVCGRALRDRDITRSQFVNQLRRPPGIDRAFSEKRGCGGRAETVEQKFRSLPPSTTELADAAGLNVEKVAVRPEA